MLTIIAAIGCQRQIGRHNRLPWHNKEDLAFFKNTTLHQKVVMGRKTYESLPNKLTRRDIYVVSTTMKKSENFEIITDFNDFCKKEQHSAETFFIAGGAQIYQMALPYCQQLILSRIPYEGIADTFFPEIPSYFRLVKKEIKQTFSVEYYEVG